VLRNAGNLAKLAKQRLDEGKPAEAAQIYARYIGLRPEDNEAYAEYAKLMLARAEAPDATRNDLGRAYKPLGSCRPWSASTWNDGRSTTSARPPRPRRPT
jgi:hypothetical protein